MSYERLTFEVQVKLVVCFRSRVLPIELTDTNNVVVCESGDSVLVSDQLWVLEGAQVPRGSFWKVLAHY